jgi:hypothetical protein
LAAMAVGTTHSPSANSTPMTIRDLPRMTTLSFVGLRG